MIGEFRIEQSVETAVALFGAGRRSACGAPTGPIQREVCDALCFGTKWEIN